MTAPFADTLDKARRRTHITVAATDRVPMAARYAGITDLPGAGQAAPIHTAVSPGITDLRATGAFTASRSRLRAR